MKTHLSTGILCTLVVIYMILLSVGATMVNSEPLWLLLIIPCLVALYYLYKSKFRVPVNFSVILELFYGFILWLFLLLYVDIKQFDFSDESLILFSGLLFLILTTEWTRRYRYKIDRPKYEKYFFIPAMFFALLFCMYFVDSLNN